jgi:uncharacterized integral membrane protein
VYNGVTSMPSTGYRLEFALEQSLVNGTKSDYNGSDSNVGRITEEKSSLVWAVLILSAVLLILLLVILFAFCAIIHKSYTKGSSAQSWQEDL